MFHLDSLCSGTQFCKKMRTLLILIVGASLMSIGSTDPVCPEKTSTGIYPDCTCLHKNFDYINDLNKCVRVCPENSTGYFPHCSCDIEGYEFIKDSFLCYKSVESQVYCPYGSSGEYPHCICYEPLSYFNYKNNSCDYICPTIGTYPQCVCENDDATYEPQKNRCENCPAGTTGKYPHCVCENDYLGYEPQTNLCKSCPAGTTGKYPNCFCEDPFVYVKQYGSCVRCPEDTSGIYPNCQCKTGYFNKFEKICMECPFDSTVLYPDCKCQNESAVFSAYINECYIACPENGFGIHPACDCAFGSLYDSSEFLCKSYIGRECPPNSIGTGPDCLCVEENNRFDTFQWICTSAARPVEEPLSMYCPDGGKWPQCEISLDINVRLSLIG